MNKRILLLPGQGSQYVGMAGDFFAEFKSVQQLFALASDVSGFNCKGLLLNSTDAELKETQKTQVAVTLSNLATYTALIELGLKREQIEAVAGFSLGEYSALAVAEVVSYEEVFKLVHKRGQLMAEEGRSIIEKRGAVAMAAVMGLSANQVEEVVQNHNSPALFCANYNSPVQTIISGLEAEIDQVSILLKEAGAKRVIKLAVSGPFHTPLLNEASKQFASFVELFNFKNPSLPLYSNVNGLKIDKGENLKNLLIKQIASPVLWTKLEQNIKIFAPTAKPLECGPGTVLSGLWKAMFSEEADSCATLEQAKQIVSQDK